MKIKTTFLKLILVGFALFIFFLCFLLTIGMVFSINEHTIFLEQIIASMSLYLSAIASLAILYNMYRILQLIDKNAAFSNLSLKYVKSIFRLTIMEFVVLLGILPFFMYVANHDDAPGFMIISFGILMIPLAVATLISILEKLLVNAIELKDDNELTI